MERTVTRRAVVTGGAGFIGSHLCEMLVRGGWRVFSLDDCSTGSPENLERARSMGVETLDVDITTPDLDGAMAEARPQAVFHLAAMSSVTLCARDPERCRAVNVEGTARVWEAAGRSGAEKLVNVSSLAVHGVSPDPYGQSKQAAETFLARRESSAHMRLTTLRPANVYGPRQPGDGESAVVATWLGAMARGEPLFLDGDGRQGLPLRGRRGGGDGAGRRPGGRTHAGVGQGSGDVPPIAPGDDERHDGMAGASRQSPGAAGRHQAVGGGSPSRRGSARLESRNGVGGGSAPHLGVDDRRLGRRIQVHRNRSSEAGRISSVAEPSSAGSESPRTIATGMPPTLPFTRSAAAAISSATATSVTSRTRS